MKNENTYCFPPIAFLKKQKSYNTSDNEIRETAHNIQNILFSFGVKAQVANVCIGTRFTRYEIIPEPGIRIREILRLKSEISMAVSSSNIHLETSILGKNAIGIDIENEYIPALNLRTLFETEKFSNTNTSIPLAIGMDSYSTKPIMIDLNETSNLLLSGTTGSGKTVCINAMVMSTLYKAPPDKLKILMIDTKGISLNIYNGIPHLIMPVITDISQSLSALYWIMEKIQERYRKFAEINVRNLKEYNYFSRGKNELAQILVIIDDLYNLIAENRHETELLLTQIARLSRDAGICLVISTQRPSIDAVAGIIKANVPNRIAFSMFSSIDSRTILDEKGAEELLRNGDMLIKLQGNMKPIRVQGAYVSDKEIANVVEFLKRNNYKN